MEALAITLPHSCGQSTQSFYPFLKHVSVHQHPSVGLPGLSKFAVIGVILSWSSSQDLILGHKGSGGPLFLISFWHGSTPFTGDTLLQRTRCPGIGPVPILAQTVEDQASSSAGRPHCTAVLFLLGRSYIPWAGWLIQLPLHPAWGLLPVVLANCLIHFFLPWLCGMQEHPVEDEWVVGSTSLPP